VADDGHVFGTMANAQGRAILIECHVEGPVGVVLDGPVAAHGVGEGTGCKDSGRDIGPPFGLDPVTALDPALDHRDGDELWEAECAWI
jgi:hypothetical protein